MVKNSLPRKQKGAASGLVSLTGQIAAPGSYELIAPAELATLAGGTWTGGRPRRIDYIREDLDNTEQGLKDFLYAPELFFRQGSTLARAALLTAPQAVEQGAAGCLVSERPRNLRPDIPCLVVANVSDAVAALARRQRAGSAAKFVAVTGSIGKSSTKNMIHALLSAHGPATRSISNYNFGNVSVNYVLANLASRHRYCVAEFSEDAENEARIALYRPHVAVITNIDWEHAAPMEASGYFGDEVIKRLVYLGCAIVRNLQSGGRVVLDRDHPNYPLLAAEVAKTAHAHVTTFGNGTDADVRLIGYEPDETGSWIAIGIGKEKHRFRLGIPGAHMARNAVAAVSAVHAMGLDVAASLEALSDFRPDSRRGVRYLLPWKEGEIEVLDENVSSNLPGIVSMLNSLHAATHRERKIAVLGIVKGLGSTMPDAMADLAAFAANLDIDHFYTIGEDIAVFNRCFPDRSRIAPHAQTLEHLEQQLAEGVMAGDLVGFKSSAVPGRISLRRLLKRMQEKIPGPSQQPADAGRPARLVICGDTYFGETFQAEREKKGDLNYLRAFGYEYSFEAIGELTRRADCAVINLECALTERPKSDYQGRRSVLLKGDPERTIAALKALNVHGAMLGNDHSKDFGENGLRDTIGNLERADIVPFGAGEDKAMSQRAFIREFDVGSTRFRLAIISAYEYTDFDDSVGFYAGSASPGVNNLNFDRITAQIAALKATGHYVIVSPHWGADYCLRTYTQKHLARRLVYAGADLILGHGPHVANQIEKIEDVWVAFSLGNFVLNSNGEYEDHALLPFSLIAEIELRERIAGVTGMLNLYPFVCCNQMTQFRPTFADDRQFDRFVQTLRGLYYDPELFSSDLGSRKIDGRHCLTAKLF
ncbi:MAG: CapA family protein [Parvibaculaceae bacterium]